MRAKNQKVTEEVLRTVARVYLAAPKWPTKAVAEALGCTHDMAAKRVQAARRAGLLPPTTIGSHGKFGKGLHVPRRFTTDDAERSVKVSLCDTCHVPWPCPEAEPAAGYVRLYVEGDTLVAKAPGVAPVSVTTTLGSVTAGEITGIAS